MARNFNDEQGYAKPEFDTDNPYLPVEVVPGRIALIDGDIIPYEIGGVCGFEGDEDIKPIELVNKLVGGLIKKIVAGCGAEDYKIFLSGADNFREYIAVTKPYKDNRAGKLKPFHFQYIRDLLVDTYDAQIIDDMEADDAICMSQTDDTVICTRDKDLRHTPGLHYSWACGKQAEIGPYSVDELGKFWSFDPKKGIKGDGLRFFYSQLLTGDSTDNIPGAKGVGPAKAYEVLKDCKSALEMEAWCYYLYMLKHGEHAQRRLIEQGRLLWMVRELHYGNPVMWSPHRHPKTIWHIKMKKLEVISE